MYHKLPKDWELIGSAPVLKRQGECVMLSFVFSLLKKGTDINLTTVCLS